MARLGVIGGSGMQNVPGLTLRTEHHLMTPFGAPSAPIIEGTLGDVSVLFLARHGVGHRVAPHEINYRANICAMKQLGAEQLVSLSAVGSLVEHAAPGDVVVVDQYFDFTKSRKSTFFEGGVVAHVAFADPVCPNLSVVLSKAARDEGARVHFGGSYVCIEGPQFSTRAESRFYKSLGAIVIGMTALPEAKLAREAGLPYATVGFVTDYDAWHEGLEAVSVEAILAVLQKNSGLAQRIVSRVLDRLPDPAASSAPRALEHAILSQGPLTPEVEVRLGWLLGAPKQA